MKKYPPLHNRKAQMSWVVGIILVLIAAFVLFGISGKIIEIIKGGGEDAACTASAQLSSKTKIAGVETISLNCPINLEEVTMADLRAGITKAGSQLDKIAKYNQENPNNQIKVEYYQGYTTDINKKMEFTLNSKIAEEMRKCWSKLGEGKLDMFSSWYSADHSIWKQITGEDRAPITCVVCSRIKFDKDIQQDYAQVDESFNEWLRINTVPKREVTYYDYLIDEVHDQILFTPKWSYTTAEPVAVVFARMNPQYLMNAAGNAMQFLDITKAQEAVDALYLIPYNQVGEKCDYLANKPPEEIK